MYPNDKNSSETFPLNSHVSPNVPRIVGASPNDCRHSFEFVWPSQDLAIECHFPHFFRSKRNIILHYFILFGENFNKLKFTLYFTVFLLPLEWWSLYFSWIVPTTSILKCNSAVLWLVSGVHNCTCTERRSWLSCPLFPNKIIPLDFLNGKWKNNTRFLVWSSLGFSKKFLSRYSWSPKEFLPGWS